MLYEHENAEYADALSHLITNHQSPLEPTIIFHQFALWKIQSTAQKKKYDELLVSMSKLFKQNRLGPTHIDDDILKIFYNQSTRIVMRVEWMILLVFQ